MNLYDEAEIVRVYIESEKRKQAEDMARKLIKEDKLSMDEKGAATGL